MTFKPNDPVTYFPQTHPRTPRPAVFVAAHATRVRIRLTEPDGNTRTILTMADCIGKPMPDFGQAVPTVRPGFRI